MSKKWQNLFHKCCPNCSAALLDSGLFWKCPANTEQATCFFINKKKAAEFLLDPGHPAYRHLEVPQQRVISQVSNREISEVELEAAINNLNLA